MKILPSKIKKWSFKQRLFEIQRRLIEIQKTYNQNYDEHVVYSEVLIDALNEAKQIVDYWMKHMAGEVDKPTKPKKKKPVNLWE